MGVGPIGLSRLSNPGVKGLDRRFATIFEGRSFGASYPEDSGYYVEEDSV
jgi:hypothetical protein